MFSGGKETGGVPCNAVLLPDERQEARGDEKKLEDKGELRDGEGRERVVEIMIVLLACSVSRRVYP